MRCRHKDIVQKKQSIKTDHLDITQKYDKTESEHVDIAQNLTKLKNGTETGSTKHTVNPLIEARAFI